MSRGVIRGVIPGPKSVFLIKKRITFFSVFLILSGMFSIPTRPLINEAVASVAARTVNLEATTAGRVTMGDLASRSLNKQLTKSGVAAPFTMTGTDNRIVGSDKTYQYLTDANYGLSTGSGHSSCQTGASFEGTRGCIAQLRESDERAAPGAFTYERTTGIEGARSYTQLYSNGNINRTPAGSSTDNTTTSGNRSFASHFGPNVWSSAFQANDTQSVSFEWRASGGGDDYEVYGFLVAVTPHPTNGCSATTDYGTVDSLTSHTTAVYGRGLRSDALSGTSQWVRSSARMPSTGCYRFRFVNGSYDASGGFLVGATFQITPLTLGTTSSITFPALSDRVRPSAGSTDFQFDSATVTSGGAITYSSRTPSQCSIPDSTTAVVRVPSTATLNGACTIRADVTEAAGSAFAPAASSYRSFNIISTATAPNSSGGDLVSGVRTVCSTLSVTEGTWTDGGSPITSTTYQWRRDGANISGATSSTYVPVAADVGKAISFSITKTNSIGSTTATSDNSFIIIDTRLQSLTPSSGTLSPPFDGCLSSYSVQVSTSQFRFTPTSSSGSATLEVNTVSVLSGQSTNFYTLNAGANTFNIKLTNSTFETTTVLTVTYSESPTVTAVAPTSVTGTQATLQGLVNPNGNSTTGVEILLTETSLDSTTTYSISPGTISGATSNSVNVVAAGLVPSTAYSYVIRATNSVGTTTSSPFRFVTPAAPTVSNDTFTVLTSSSVRLSGDVTPNGDSGPGNETIVRFEYSLNADLSDSTTVIATTNGTISGGVATSSTSLVDLTGLQVGKTYFFRTRVTNPYGSNVGTITSFTLRDKPSVGILPPSETTTTTAAIRAEVNPNADPTTQIVFKWGTSSSNPSTIVAATPSVISGSETRTVTASLTSLSAGTTYYYRVVATNSFGSETSTIQSFTTAVDLQPSATLSGPATSDTATPITITVTFSEAVNGFSSSDLVFSIGGNYSSTGWTAAIASEISSSVYSVEYSPGASALTGVASVHLPAGRVTEVTGSLRGNLISETITVTISIAGSSGGGGGGGGGGSSDASSPQPDPNCPSPVIESISPQVVSNLNPERVTISGRNLTSMVYIDNTQADVRLQDSNRVVIVTPIRTAGVVQVRVNGCSSFSTILLTMDSRPQVTSYSPSEGTTLGGTEIKILGAQLANSSVKIGDREALITLNSSGLLTLISPKGSPGRTKIRVSNSSGFLELDFEYFEPPYFDEFKQPYIKQGDETEFSTQPRNSRNVLLSSGALPPGLSLSSSGNISGTANRFGRYTFTLIANGGGGTSSKEFEIVIDRPTPSDRGFLLPFTFGQVAPTDDYLTRLQAFYRDVIEVSPNAIRPTLSLVGAAQTTSAYRNPNELAKLRHEWVLEESRLLGIQWSSTYSDFCNGEPNRLALRVTWQTQGTVGANCLNPITQDVTDPPRKESTDPAKAEAPKLDQEPQVLATSKFRVFFGMNSSTLRKEERAKLRDFLQAAISEFDGLEIEVYGYAQPTPGTESTDTALSRDRAIRVANFIERNLDLEISELAGRGRANANKASSRFVEVIVRGIRR